MAEEFDVCWSCKGSRIGHYGNITTGCVICEGTGKLPKGYSSYDTFKRLADKQGADLDKIAGKLKDDGKTHD